MKILLCLLSDQHVPNLLSIHHFCPDRLVLVESEQMKGKSKALLAALKTGGDNDVLDYADRCSIVPLDASTASSMCLICFKGRWHDFQMPIG